MGRSTGNSASIVAPVVGGLLMGLANLVPGVSGGTMLLVVGIYDSFIAAVADATRFRFTRRTVVFLSIVGGAAAAAIGFGAGQVSELVQVHRSGMYCLFIGLTLGGVPPLMRALRPLRKAVWLSVALGIGLMILVAAGQDHQNGRTREDAITARDRTPRIQPDYARDALAGALGMSAMILPGVSGAYMLLLMGRYEAILASISVVKDTAVSMHAGVWFGPATRVLVPTAIGSAFSLIVLTNLLKWLLNRHRRATTGFLVGIVLGSVVGLWPFEGSESARDYGSGIMLAGGGFALTTALAWVASRNRCSESHVADHGDPR